jgi:hypothetical protein
MTIQELIDQLQEYEDKTIEVCFVDDVNGFIPAATIQYDQEYNRIVIEG